MDVWLSCFREEWKSQKELILWLHSWDLGWEEFYEWRVGGEANLLSCGGQLLTQNDSSLVLPIIGEVFKNFGGAMHKVAPPLDVHELGWDVFSTQLTMVD